MPALAPEEMPDTYIRLFNFSPLHLVLKHLRKHQSRPAFSVVILAPALASVPMRLVKPDGIAISLIHMQPNRPSACLPRRTFHSRQQPPADAAPALLPSNLNSLYISNQPAPLPRPLNNPKARHSPILLRNPGSRIRAIYQVPHIPAPKSKRRLKTDLLNRIKLRKIFSGVETIVHSPTLNESYD